MSFFLEGEAESLQIARLILHVVGNREEIRPQEELSAEDAPAFFVKRILSSAASPVHKFAEGSQTKAILAKLCASHEDFVAQSYELSRLFAKDHSGSTTDGAFFVIVLHCHNIGTSFVCLIKYDYREAVELVEHKGKAGLRSIVQAFVADRTAIQKFCIARVDNGVVQELVCASDRSTRAPDLTHYFERFLDVTRDRTDEEISRNLQEAIRQTLVQCQDILPQNSIPQAL